MYHILLLRRMCEIVLDSAIPIQSTNPIFFPENPKCFEFYILKDLVKVRHLLFPFLRQINNESHHYY